MAGKDKKKDKKGLLSRWVEKLDKKLEEKAKCSCSCCGSKPPEDKK